ncbi:nucleoside recognition domain-containing protein [Sporosarcina sp. P33]|uniref:nucleoside recognition domain-containing protein n=1 Tax=Sporosarcina sp. P33 TaxID=1930764 RepID=UPI0009C13B8B|nr:nucleoside recognition domain-containing protein [Sporosarcina sp. P33]ARD47641.1 hypothetical protein SporoP33_04900 [Sporosarcina sp. P33]
MTNRNNIALSSTMKDGLQVGLKTTWSLGKIIFPITLLVTILQFTPVLPWLVQLIEPLMQVFGLRGEAAVPIVLGNTLNLYAGIAGIISLELTVKEVFIIAMMISFAHNLFIETAVAIKVGVKLWLVLAVRLGLAALAGIIINLFWTGGSEIAQYGLTPQAQAVPEGFVQIFLLGLEKAAFGVLQLAMIVIPLMLFVQFVKDRNYLDRLSNSLAPFTKLIGVKPNASMTLVAGILIGLAYGAGVMIQAVREDGVSKRDITLAFIFLMACHAVIEDTLLFLPLGIPIWPLLIIRLVTAIALTLSVSVLWKRPHEKEEAVID